MGLRVRSSFYWTYEVLRGRRAASRGSPSRGGGPEYEQIGRYACGLNPAIGREEAVIDAGLFPTAASRARSWDVRQGKPLSYLFVGLLQL